MNQFDILAARAIDPVLNAITMENDSDPDFVISVQPDYSPTRSRCLLTVRARSPAESARRTASLVIRAESDEIISVERCLSLVDGGKPQLVASLGHVGVTREAIEKLARDFVSQARDDLQVRHS